MWPLLAPFCVSTMASARSSLTGLASSESASTMVPTCLPSVPKPATRIRIVCPAVTGKFEMSERLPVPPSSSQAISVKPSGDVKDMAVS